MKSIELTSEEVKAFNSVHEELPTVGYLLIEIPHPDNPDTVLVGIVHPHSNCGIDFHKTSIDRKLDRDPTDTGC